METTKKKIIPIEVRDEYILGSGVSIGAAGSFDSMVLRVKFDESWMGLNKYATWTDAQGNVGDQTIITALDLVGGEVYTYDIPVPKFATQHAGTVRLSFTGYVIGGDANNTVESLINTATGAFRVLESSATRLDGGNTAASIADQLLKQLADHMTEVNGEVEAIEKSVSLVEGRMTTVEGEMEAVKGAEEERRKTFEKAESQRQSAFEAAEAERNQIVGNLNKALDSIIALQKSYIGGEA